MNVPVTNPRKERLVAYGVLTLSLLTISALLTGPLWTLYVSLTDQPVVIPRRPGSTTGQGNTSSVPSDATDSHSMALRAAEAAVEDAVRAVKGVITPQYPAESSQNNAAPNQATCIRSTSANLRERVEHETQMLELGCTLPLADPPKAMGAGHSAAKP
jgi:hypothetical protein